MSVADFRDIALERGPRHGERVFRAAVSAFSSLLHPTREDAARLDDLALGLYDSVPSEARRFAAAALSDCDPAPRHLVARLADESADIAAPILIRSKALRDIDLIGLIARRGIPHARAIARREGLHPTVAALIRALLSRVEPETTAALEMHDQESAMEAVRNQLLGLMDEARIPEEEPRPSPSPHAATEVYPALREAVLCGEMRRLAEQLAAALELRIARARTLVSGVTYSDLLPALKALELSTEQALLLVLAAYPAQVTGPPAIRLFCVRYEALTPEAAREKVLDWQEQDIEKGSSHLSALSR
uniref:DUF2336 domain-containing protein n=1 Tax=Chelativorans sp. (strain BNC1) TaxID=266779 RepID=Q11JZ5_CHESB